MVLVLAILLASIANNPGAILDCDLVHTPVTYLLLHAEHESWGKAVALYRRVKTIGVGDGRAGGQVPP